MLFTAAKDFPQADGNLVKLIRKIHKYVRIPGMGRLLLSLIKIFSKGERKVPLEGTNQIIIVSPFSLIEATILLTGTYEPEVFELMKKTLRPGMCALDVGANIGAHTIHMAHLVGSDGSVWAFEPNPETYGRLCENINLNRLTMVRAIQAGIGSKDGQQTLYVNSSENWNRNATMIRDPENTGIPIPVRVVPLDVFGRST